jgi:hypothetical protein
MSRARFVYSVFLLTAAMVFTVHLRTSSTRLFNQYRSAKVTQKQITQHLWQQQLRFENLINPAGLTVPPEPAPPEIKR